MELKIAIVASLGETIRSRRLDLRLSLREMARRVGVSPPYLTDLEADRRHPGPEVMARLSEQLGLAPSVLEVLDTRLRPDVRRWVEGRPEVGQLLRRIKESPRQEQLLRELRQVVDDAHDPAPDA